MASHSTAHYLFSHWSSVGPAVCLMSDKYGLIQPTQVAHPSTLSMMAWARFHWNYMRAIFQLVGWSDCLPYIWLPRAFLWLYALQVYRSIRNSSNNEWYQSYCVNVPWVKIRWNLPLWGLQSIFALQNWSSIDNLHLGWPFITAHILESQYCLESE